MIDGRTADDELAEAVLRRGWALAPEPPEIQALLARVYADWAAFFASPSKFAEPSHPEIPQGYLPFCQPGGAELKESYYHQSTMRLPPRVRGSAGELIQYLGALAWRLAESLRRASGATLVNHPRTGCLRAMRYAAFAGAPESPLMRRLAHEGSWRAIAHSDLNSLSLLPSPTAPGLEVLDVDGVWRLVDAAPGATVIMAGQELERRTGSRVRATFHRVRNPTETEMKLTRLSLAYFVA